MVHNVCKLIFFLGYRLDITQLERRHTPAHTPVSLLATYYNYIIQTQPTEMWSDLISTTVKLRQLLSDCLSSIETMATILEQKEAEIEQLHAQTSDDETDIAEPGEIVIYDPWDNRTDVYTEAEYEDYKRAHWPSRKAWEEWEQWRLDTIAKNERRAEREMERREGGW